MVEKVVEAITARVRRISSMMMMVAGVERLAFSAFFLAQYV